jgi:hypothetical protein
VVQAWRAGGEQSDDSQVHLWIVDAETPLPQAMPAIRWPCRRSGGRAGDPVVVPQCGQHDQRDLAGRQLALSVVVHGTTVGNACSRAVFPQV